MQTEISKGITVGYENGVAFLQAKVGELIVAPIERIEAKIQSGEIDLIKGTDIDKDLLLKITAALKAEILK